MKLIHLTHNFLPFHGGIETFVQSLCKLLIKKGVECRVVCFDRAPGSREKFKPAETIDGIPVKRVPFVDFKYYKFAPAVLLHLKDADIAHVHNIGFLSDFIVLTKWLHRKRIVVNTHGGFFHTKKIGFLKGIYLAWLKLLFRGVDLVIADSKSDFEIFSNVTKKIVLIENGVELESFEQLRRNPKKNSFLFLGRLSKNKRIDLLLETFAELKKKGIGFRLLVVGKDFEGLLAGLKTRARELGIGKETEFFPDASDKELLSLLSSSEFFVSASSFEGFGIAAIEAMAAGCIPILNDIPCFKDFVNDGKSGFIADFFEPKKAAEKIMSILQLGKKRLAAVSAAARYSAQRFSFEKKIPQFVSAYWQVLK